MKIIGGVLFVIGCMLTAMHGLVWLIIYLVAVGAVMIVGILLSPCKVDDALLDEENRIIDLLEGEPMSFSLIPSDHPGFTARAITDMVREGIAEVVYSGGEYAVRYIKEG